MQNSFEKDFFTIAEICWSKKNYINDNSLKKIILFLKKKNCGKVNQVKKRSGLEKNSSNYLITINKKKFILKKWNKSLSKKKIKNILDLTIWLKEKKIFFPDIKIIDNNSLFLVDSFYWTIFSHSEGSHFSGEIKEFKNLSNSIGKFFSLLSKYPKKIDLGPKFYKKKSLLILKKMKSNKRNWDSYFGKKTSSILKETWGSLEEMFLQNMKIKKVPHLKQITHFDLHPHNVIMKNKRVNCFLDFEACGVMNPGFGLAFSCLKLCKQTIIYNKISKKTLLYKKFIKLVSQHYPEIKKIQKYFFYFATSEVLRRILIIFEQNLEFKLKTWNKVLPIQLAHLEESKILFNKK